MSDERADRLQQLEKEVEVSFYQASGPGGQHRNRTYSAVRIRHPETGVVVTSSSHRSQHRNRREAMERLLSRLEELERVDPPRVPTRKGAAARRRERQEKDRQSQKKRLRRTPDPGED